MERPEEEYLFQWRLGPDSKVVACGQVADRDFRGFFLRCFFREIQCRWLARRHLRRFRHAAPRQAVDYDAASDFQFQPDGKILYIGTTTSKFLMGRLLPNGTPDATFHGIGYRVFPGIVPEE